MRVADVMSYRPIVVDAFETVDTAAELMRAHVVGALPVLERGRLVGVVTDRDLVVRCLAPGRPPRGTHVREVMTAEPASCRPDEALHDAVDRMLARRVRRLIVVDESGDVAGMLSTDDLALLDETRAIAGRVLQHVAALRGQLDGTFAEPRP